MVMSLEYLKHQEIDAGHAGYIVTDTIVGYSQSHPAAEQRVRRVSNTIGKS